jgi:Holliday junction DNA helicase RuvA
MIALLTGLLAFKAPALVTVDVHGVGYEVLIPLSTYYALPNPSESVTLRIHTPCARRCDSAVWLSHGC